MHNADSDPRMHWSHMGLSTKPNEEGTASRWHESTHELATDHLEARICSIGKTINAEKGTSKCFVAVDQPLLI